MCKSKWIKIIKETMGDVNTYNLCFNIYKYLNTWKIPTSQGRHSMELMYL
jgi:hypothetical protein